MKSVAGYGCLQRTKDLQRYRLFSRQSLSTLSVATRTSTMSKRLIAATVDDVRVVCAYMPNGQEVA